MSAENPDRQCPNCLTLLEADSTADAALRCPVCQFTLRRCPDCGGEMWKQVDAPEGVEIEPAGLPLGRCAVLWVCRDPACGGRLEADL